MTEIKLVRQSDKKDELLDLYKVSFGSSGSSALWDWKYLHNPFAKKDPEIIIAMDKGKIVGARPVLLAEMWLNNEKVKVAQPSDTMVHPEYRREGIFSRMNQFAIEYYEKNNYTLFYNFPGTMSYSGYLKQGWQIVSITEDLFMVTNPQKIISCKLANKSLSYVLGFFYDNFLNSRKEALQPSSFQIKICDRLTNDVERIDTLRNKSGIELVRDATYLNWRFDQHPEHSYKYILASENDRLAGYAVTSVQEKSNGLIFGMVVDYLVRDNNIDCFRSLMNGCLKELEKINHDIVSIWIFGQPEFRDVLMKQFGFKSPLKLPYSWLNWKGYFIVREINKQLPAKPDIYDSQNWRITHAYCDTA